MWLIFFSMRCCAILLARRWKGAAALLGSRRTARFLHATRHGSPSKGQEQQEEGDVFHGREGKAFRRMVLPGFDDASCTPFGDAAKARLGRLQSETSP